MADISVRATPTEDGWTFDVTVREGGSETRHRVTMSGDVHERLAGDACAPEELVRQSFEFLLEREPKESILREFDITVISRYFPEYEDRIRERIRQ